MPTIDRTLFDDHTGASFSECRRYRYTLWRVWGDRLVNFIMLNPSTADAIDNDPTIRRCIGFVKSWGYGGLLVTNLFAFRATDPKAMKAADDPVGEGNNDAIIESASQSAIVIRAWGAHGSHGGRAAAVNKMLADLCPAKCHHLKMGREQPCHPLYLPGNLQPTRA